MATFNSGDPFVVQCSPPVPPPLIPMKSELPSPGSLAPPSCPYSAALWWLSANAGGSVGRKGEKIVGPWSALPVLQAAQPIFTSCSLTPPSCPYSAASLWPSANTSGSVGREGEKIIGPWSAPPVPQAAQPIFTSHSLTPPSCPYSAALWWPPANTGGSIGGEGKNIVGPWSALPIPQAAQPILTYPTATNIFQPLSPLSLLLSLLPIADPMQLSPPPLPPPLPPLLPTETAHWPLQTESFFEPVPRLRHIVCTCPNCTSRAKTKASNGDGSPKKHICHYPNCAKVYGKTSHLRAHLWWHTGEQPFVCHSCGKCFTHSDELQHHFRVHTGEKQFVCPKCSKRFMWSDHMKKHVKTHHNKEQ